MNDVLEIALAGCLHDVGKLFQRAGTELTDSARRMEPMLCPTDKAGYPTHRHVLWTNEFIERYLAWLPPSVDKARLNDLASSHHRPSEPLHWILAEADRLASGHDRRPAEREADGGYLCVPLSSILAGLSLQHGPVAAPPWYGPAHDLSVCVSPRSDFPVPNLRHEYAAVADAMIAGMAAWTRVPEPVLCGCFASLSARYLAMSPASTIDMPDTSLHDHNMLVAAFAAALFRYHKRTDSLQELAIRDRTSPKFRLVCGDLSGIQKFIFAPAPEGLRKGIARTFRARSFYLSMLTRVAVFELLRAVGLPIFNCVIDAGGRFVLLVDNTDETLRCLEAADQRIQQSLVEAHHGVLALNIDWSVTAGGTDFLAPNFGSLYRRIQAGAEAARSRRLAGWLQPGGSWDEAAQCLRQVNPRRCAEAAARLFTEFGRRLPDARFVAVLAGGVACPGLLNDEDAPRLFGRTVQLLDSPVEAMRADDLVDLFALEVPAPGPHAWLAHVPVANYVPRLSPDDRSCLAARPRPRDDGNDPQADAREVGDLATFEDLANLASGAAMIAVLKADVDRLGLLFSRGFRDNASFGRIATLSRALDGFFKVFLPARFVEPDSPYRLVYTVFAGGDDLLLVGPWNLMMRLAADLHRWFTQFACANPDVALSAALVLGKPKTPIASLGRLAEEHLETAKDAGRNCIAVFGRVFPWADYLAALDAGERLSRLAAGSDPARPKLPTAFLYQLLRAGRLVEEIDEAPRRGRAVPLDSLAWRSHLAYDFRRNVLNRIKPDRLSDEGRDDLQWLEELMGLNVPRDRRTERILRLAATYALYLNRGGAS